MNANRQFRRRVRFRDRKAYAYAQRIAARLTRTARLVAPPPDREPQGFNPLTGKKLP